MRLSRIAEIIGVDYSGPDIEIEGLGTLKNADKNRLSFFDNPKYLADLRQTKAGAVLVAPRFAEEVPQSSVALVTDEPYLKLALASGLFAPSPMRSEGAEPIIGEGTTIGANVTLGKDVKIGRNVTIMPGCYLGDDVSVGDDTLLYPNVVVYHGCRIGARCIVHAGSVIGSDGYGFAHTKTGEHVKLHQLGRVVIEDEVEIGANCAIDRGALEATIIKKGTKIDNLVHMAHNCEVGPHALLTAQVGLSGSTKLGRNVVMGGQSGTAGHLEVGDFATIAARGGVTKSLEGGKTYAGFPAVEIGLWRKMNALLMHMVKSRKKGEKQ